MKAHISGKDLKESTGKPIVLGDGNTYHLTIDMNAMCALEDHYGDFDRAMDVLANIGTTEKGPDGKVKPKKIMKDIRFMLWAALQHDNDDLTEHDAAKLITLNNMNEVMNALGAAMIVATPEPEEDEKNTKGPQED
ncbi:hypothetical protein ACVS9P_02430 [Caproicibacterium sp. NSD3]